MPNDDDDYEYEDDDEEGEKWGRRKQNRESAQKDVDNVVRDLHLDADERGDLHELLKEDYLGYQEILRRAKENFPIRHIKYKDGEKDRW
ncbi:hypothetical protein [Aerosakkonema funiforme]|uniref:hypothetical protein n=1 Tax=Aerosakkonema funiforme TaxID=1246630 RepID=UPI0035B83024